MQQRHLFTISTQRLHQDNETRKTESQPARKFNMDMETRANGSLHSHLFPTPFPAPSTLLPALSTTPPAIEPADATPLCTVFEIQLSLGAIFFDISNVRSCAGIRMGVLIEIRVGERERKLAWHGPTSLIEFSWSLNYSGAMEYQYGPLQAPY